MADFIYNDQGVCVARIINGDVFTEEKNPRRIATIRQGNIFALNGELIGHLQGAGLVRKDGDVTPEAFTKLLSGE
jgi:hypothetical protein